MPIIKGHYTVDGVYEAIEDVIEDAWEEFLEMAGGHFNPTLLNGPTTEEEDDLPF